MLPSCPGRKLTEAQHNANYDHYCNSTVPFACKACCKPEWGSQHLTSCPDNAGYHDFIPGDLT